jgi:hypothetical protein
MTEKSTGKLEDRRGPRLEDNFLKCPVRVYMYNHYRYYLDRL